MSWKTFFGDPRTTLAGVALGLTAVLALGPEKSTSWLVFLMATINGWLQKDRELHNGSPAAPDDTKPKDASAS